MSWNTYRNSFLLMYLLTSSLLISASFSSKDSFNQTIIKCPKGECFEISIWSFASFFPSSINVLFWEISFIILTGQKKIQESATFQKNNRKIT